MSTKEEILKKYRSNVRERYDMPDLSDIRATVYPNPLAQFVKMSEAVGGKVIDVEDGCDVNALISDLFPEAKEIASNLPEITCATRNPDTVSEAADLNGTDVGVVRGCFGVAENGCVWIPQQMKEKAVCFISENLVILLPKSQIVNNMHEAYRLLDNTVPITPSSPAVPAAPLAPGLFDYYGYGTFISGPSKTADIAQVLVMGAQAARSATILLMPE